MTFRHRVALLAIMAVLAAGAARAEEWPDRLRVVYLPADGKEAVLKRFAPFNEYLGRMLGVTVEPVSFDTYAEVIAFIGRGDFELAYLGPSTYCQALPWMRLEVLAMELDQEGRRGYHSLIISRPERQEPDLRDFGGKVFAFTSPESTSGFIVPLHHFLLDLRLTPGMFADRVVFAGNHRRSVRGVLDGEYDLGVVSSIDLERIEAEWPEARSLRVVWRSGLIPGSLFAIHPGAPEGFAAAAQAVICNFGADHARARALGCGGFVPATGADYLPISRLEAFRP